MSIRQVAIGYIKTLTYEDRDKLRTMLNNGVICGSDYAIENNLEPSILSNELKSILNGD